MGELARVEFDVVVSSLAMAELARVLQLAIASSSLFSPGQWMIFIFFPSFEWGLNPLFPHSNPNFITLPTGSRGPTQYFAKLVYFPI